MDVIHLELKLSDSNKEMAALHTLYIYVGPLYCNLIGKIHYYYLLQYWGGGVQNFTSRVLPKRNSRQY